MPNSVHFNTPISDEENNPQMPVNTMRAKYVRHFVSRLSFKAPQKYALAIDLASAVKLKSRPRQSAQGMCSSSVH